MSKEIDELLLESQTAITNAIGNERVLSKMTLYGYNDAKLGTGKELLGKAQSEDQKQKKEKGESIQATNTANAVREELNTIYIPHLEIARIVFKKDAAAIGALQLMGDREISKSGYVAQTKLFYTNLLGNNNWLAAMMEYNLDEEKFKNGLLLVEKLEAAYATQKMEMGESQDATDKRDEAVEALTEWYSKFKTIARIALRGEPQLLELLGIVVKSE